jgi:hypothetical protein
MKSVIRQISFHRRCLKKMGRYILKGYAMQLPYSAIEHDVQGHNKTDLGTVNILDSVTREPLDDDLADPDNYFASKIMPSEEYERRSTSAWQAKLAAAPTARDNRRTIIRDWLDQVYDADHAIYLFRLFKLHIGSYRGSSYELMAHAAVSEFGAVALPERRTAPIPSVSRSDPFQPVSQGRGV